MELCLEIKQQIQDNMVNVLNELGCLQLVREFVEA
jgi:hypothetical protein